MKKIYINTRTTQVGKSKNGRNSNKTRATLQQQHICLTSPARLSTFASPPFFGDFCAPPSPFPSALSNTGGSTLVLLEFSGKGDPRTSAKNGWCKRIGVKQKSTREVHQKQ